MGLMSVLLSVLSTYGICSTIGLVFSPMHPMIPFLILGIESDQIIFTYSRYCTNYVIVIIQSYHLYY